MGGLTITTVLDGTWPPGLSITDNGNGTYSASVTDNGDGTLTYSGLGITDTSGVLTA